ncbi:ABC transporter ATP-binding protein [Inediibacterium massiliense]|uniref:ABC transporter ATP-binding protein n=1 Tax=Inediibacterium massiliense TaxID=1658111 RepID=UPI0006B66B1D|nr:ABC transporter ATP-binding protein [Inediibacterium massiliense]
MYQINNLSFSYDNKQVLKGIDFHIEKGKMTTIVGPNGSGKTTLLNVMNGYFDQYKGEIFLLEKNIKDYDIKELSQKIAIISQNVQIKFPFTCMEIVMMGRTPFKERMKNFKKEDLDIVYESMESTQTLQFAHIPITHLSGGEKQRVMMAKAFAQTPKVLFLDEAFSNMDIQYTIKFLNLLKKMIKEKGLTVISIMHDLNLTDLFSDHILALKNGQVVEYGLTKEVFQPELIKELFGICVKKTGEQGLVVLPNM